jgi:hypothetical protein
MATTTLVNQKINYRGELQQWAKDTERYLVRSIQNKDLIESGNLRRSMKHEVSGLLSDVKTFTFKYAQYGMYVDMGLFGGKGIAEKRDAALVNKILGGRRKREKRVKNLSKRQYMWYSRTVYGALTALSNIVAKEYGFKASEAMRMPEIMEIKL